MPYNPPKGRRDNSKNRAIDTIAPGSAEQAMLKKQDEMIDAMNSLLASLASAADVAAVNAAAAAIPAIKKIVLE